MVVTEGTQSGGLIGGEMEGEMIKRTPLGRIGLPDDITPVAVFLASDESKWVTGELLKVGGGAY